MKQLQIDEKLIFEINPTEVKVNDNLPRQRKDLGKIQDMLTSIRTFGQIQPIVINRNNELIAGGRRLAACLLGGLTVRACYKDTIDTTLMREIELEENLQRKALTPAEESLAVSELVELKQARYGKPTQGVPGGFTLNDAAAAIGKTKGSIIESIQIAEAVKAFPNLAECKTKSEIKKAVRGLERVQKQVEALSSYEDTIKQSSRLILVNRTAEEYLHNLPDNSVDLFFTDPPYGIDVHNVVKGLGGQSSNTNASSTGIFYDDSAENAKALMAVLVKEAFRITKSTGHMYMFCAVKNYWWLIDEAAKVGWLVRERPIIWIKRDSPKENNQPDKWPSSAYELIMFARKPESQLVLQGKLDYIQCDAVTPAEKVHQAEKPVALCKELISRTCLPGQYMLDPCMGSGALVEAGLQMKLFAMGCEKDVGSYALACGRLQKYVEADK